MGWWIAEIWGVGIGPLKVNRRSEVPHIMESIGICIYLLQPDH